MEVWSYLCCLVLGLLVPSAGGKSLRPPRITEQPSDVLVRRHEPATLNCKAEGAPPPAVDWYHNGQLVPRGSSANRMVLPSGALFFLHVVARVDTGSYWCVARNELGRARSRNASLEIAVLREEFRVSPRPTVVAAGHTATLECGPPRGHPEPSVRWKKDGDLVNAGTGRIRIVGGGNLVLDDVRPADGGSYRCVAENVVGLRESAPALLTVQVRPRWVRQPPAEMTALSGETLAVVCEAEGDPEPAVSWQRRGAPLPERIEEGPVLRILNVQPPDEGAYICEATNALGSIKSSTTLTVLSRPSFLEVPEDTVVEAGQSARLTCRAKGNPQPLVLWRKEGCEELKVGDVSLEVRDEGRYLCSAVSPLGSVTAQASLEILAPLPPVTLTVPQRGAVQLPPCPGRWHFETSLLAGSVPRTAYRLTDVQPSDAGLYICVDSGTVILQVDLSVIDVPIPAAVVLPGPPSKPTAVNVTETSVTIAWHPPLTVPGASTILGYLVEYQSGLDQTWKIAGHKVSGPSYQLTGLGPDTRHVFLVRTETALGPGPPSPPSDPVRTLGLSQHYELEESRVRLSNVRLKLMESRVQSSSSISLIWKMEGGGEVVEGFHIWHRQDNSSLFHLTQIADKRATQVAISDLDKFTQYQFLVAPYGKDIEGPPSNILSARTLEDLPTQPPGSLEVGRGPGPSLLITWGPPPAASIHGILQGYIVEVVVNTTHLHSELTLNATTLTATLDNVTAGCLYGVRVRAFTAAGPGPFCSPVIIRLGSKASTMLLQPWLVGALGGVLLVAVTLASIVLVVHHRRRRSHWSKPLELSGTTHKQDMGSVHETLWFNQAWHPTDKTDSSAADYAEVDSRTLSAIFFQQRDLTISGPYATTSILRRSPVNDVKPDRNSLKFAGQEDSCSDCARPATWGVPPAPSSSPPPPRCPPRPQPLGSCRPPLPADPLRRPTVDRGLPYRPLDSGGDSSDTEGLLRPSGGNQCSNSSSRASSSEGSFYGDGDNFVSALTNVVLGTPHRPGFSRQGPPVPQKLVSLQDVHWIKAGPQSGITAATQL